MCAPPAVPWQCLGVRLQQRTAPFERAQRSVLHVGAVHPCQLSASGAWDGLPLALARGSKLGEGHRKTCTGPALRIRSKSAYVCRVSLKAEYEPFLSSAIRAFSRTLLMSLDEPCRRCERLSRSSAAMGRAQCITSTPRMIKHYLKK